MLRIPEDLACRRAPLDGELHAKPRLIAASEESPPLLPCRRLDRGLDLSRFELDGQGLRGRDSFQHVEQVEEAPDHSASAAPHASAARDTSLKSVETRMRWSVGFMPSTVQ